MKRTWIAFLRQPRRLLLFLGLGLPLAATAQTGFITSTNADGTLTITHYTGSGGAVSIPSVILVNGVNRNVTSIGGDAFFNNGNVTSVTIPAGVTTIGVAAFAGCSKLTSVTIPSGVTSLGVQAFNSCPRLAGITIPASVTSIGADAFSHCTSLAAIIVDPNNIAFSSTAGVLFNHDQTSLIHYPGGVAGSYTIPDSVTSIVTGALADCPNLTAINMNADNAAFGSVAGVLFDQSLSTLIQYPGAQSGSYMIPDSVTSISTGAFYNCAGLTSVTIPANVTNLGGDAFYQCTSLTSVIIPNLITIIGGYTFYNCTNLTTVSLGDGINTIDIYAFNGCTSLTGITVPATVTRLGTEAFGNCSSMTNIAFMGNAPTVGANTTLGDNNATVYHLSGTSGWSTTFTGRPVVTLNAPAITSPPAMAAVVEGSNATFSVTASSSVTPIYQWQISADGGNNWIIVNEGTTYVGTTTATLRITAPTTSLLASQYRVLISNFAGTTTASPVPLVVGSSSAKLAWLQNNFTAAQLGNLNFVGDLASPAGDGIPNILKYALNLSALADAHPYLPQPAISNGSLVLSFQIPPTDIIYSVQTSSDLVTWTASGVTIQSNGNQETASVPINANIQAFLRLLIAPK